MSASRGKDIVQLARKVLSSANGGGGRTESFQELMAAVASTNPPPVMPRIPVDNGGDQEQRDQQHILMNRILARSKTRKLETQISGGSSNTNTAMIPEEVPLNQANSLYGTTPMKSIQTLLSVLYPQNDRVKGAFVDAGSGEGIPTLAAALSGKFTLAKGIEYTAKWHKTSLLHKQSYDDEMQHSNISNPCQLEFLCDDLTRSTATHFVGASCVYLNGVTFDADLCQALGHQLEEELVGSEDEDVFVVSMSRSLALPSFDLVDLVNLNANGDGMFKFYVSRLAREGSSHQATSDSPDMRLLRGTDDGGLVDELVELSLASFAATDNDRLGMPFVAFLAASEPTVRTNLGPSSSALLWETLERYLEPTSKVSQKAQGSMVLRAMVDHPVGRKMVADNDALLEHLVAAVDNDKGHPAIRANLLDILGQLLHDSPLLHVSYELDQVLDRQTQTMDSEVPANLKEAMLETVAMKRWWDGHQREFPMTIG